LRQWFANSLEFSLNLRDLEVVLRWRGKMKLDRANKARHLS
jgi:hypothetical protein